MEVVPVFEPEAESGTPVDKSSDTPQPIAEQPVHLASAVNPYKWWSAIFLVISIMLVLLLIEAKLRQQRELDSYLNSLQWAINQDLGYDYDEIPLSGKRLIRLAGLIAQLERVGFDGKVVVEGHIGAFCLQELGFDLGQDDNSLILPESNSLLSDCHTLGLPFAEERSIAQSDAFRDFITGFNLLQGSAIRIELVAKGDDDPLYDYPASGDNLTAGDWNVVALRNNRVRLLIKPDS